MNSLEHPIPSETVTAVQVSQLSGLTPSAALDSLIQQNLDLTTRLNVQIRRVSEMERVIQNFSSNANNFEAQKEAFREEIQVLHKRFQSQESKLLSHRIDKENAEKSYANLVIEHRSIKAKLDEEKVFKEQNRRRVDKFRYKIHYFIKPLIKSLSNDSKTLQMTLVDLNRYRRYRFRISKIVKPWVRELRYKLKTLRDRHDRLEVKNSEMQLRIEELLNHLKKQKSEHESDMQRLVSYHEARWTELHLKHQTMTIDFENLSQRQNQMILDNSSLEESNIEFQNRAISAERKYTEIETNYFQGVSELQTKNEAFEIQIQSLSRDLNQKDLQMEANQRLNQALTKDLEEERQKSEELMMRMRQMKIQEIAEKSLRNAQPLLGPPSTTTAMPMSPSEVTTDYSKLETLFAEIQSADIG